MQSPEGDKVQLVEEVKTLIDYLLGDRLVRRFDLPPLERDSFSPFNSPTFILLSQNGDESSIIISAHNIRQHLKETRMLVLKEKSPPHIVTHIHVANFDEESQSRWISQWLDKMAKVIEGQVEEASAIDLLGFKGILARISP